MRAGYLRGVGLALGAWSVVAVLNVVSIELAGRERRRRRSTIGEPLAGYADERRA